MSPSMTSDTGSTSGSTTPGTTPTVHGFCDERFGAVRDAFVANFDQGEEVGASVAITLDGEPVVDIWAGDATEGGPAWEKDTIVNVWSTTKTMAGLCMLMLADRGELDFDATVASYWPEFAAAGKEDVLVRHVMGHTAGLSGWAEPIVVDDIYDWERSTSLLAAQTPYWTPGDGSGYHAITQGHLQGEILRRITGQTMGTFFANEVAQPLGADFHIGLDPEHDHRVATLIPPAEALGGAIEDEETIAWRSLSNPPLAATDALSSGWRGAEIPAAGGHSNARAVARIHSALACDGTVDGVTLLRPESIDAVYRVQADGTDRVLGLPTKLGMGFGLIGPAAPLSPNPRAFFWGGWGGSLGLIDQDARMSVSYVMNKMATDSTMDFRRIYIVAAAYESIGQPLGL